jgi:hypothetical protein
MTSGRGPQSQQVFTRADVPEALEPARRRVRRRVSAARLSWRRDLGAPPSAADPEGFGRRDRRD